MSITITIILQVSSGKKKSLIIQAYSSLGAPDTDWRPRRRFNKM
jgi:hypothetical protein